ncbi:MAG TPA: hypothetical protein ACFYEF_11355 [Candidatus Wunengus sp. YC63]
MSLITQLIVIPQGDKVSFSERYGYKPIQEIVQIESMDEPRSKV